MSETPQLSAQAQAARQVLAEMVEKMEFAATIEVVESPEQIVLTLASELPMGLLIGKGGQTLNAIELLVAVIVQHQTGAHGKRVVVDAEGYRQRQTQRLEEIAREAAARVAETGAPVELEPMNSRDRRTVHMTIAGIDGVATYSDGEEPYRHVVVCLPEQVPEGAEA